LIDEIWPGQVVHVEALEGGHTNANYLVTIGEERVVLRVPGEKTHVLGIDREHEYEANKLASSIGVGPDVLGHSKADGWMLTGFVSGDPLSSSELSADPMLANVASTLLRVHRAGTISADLNPFAIIRQYHEEVERRAGGEPFDYPLALARLDRISEVRPYRPRAFCHNDLRNDNFLFDAQLRILDWEYAGMGDPLFDLANFSAHQQLSPDADTRLLTHYYGHHDDALLAALGLMKVVSELREIMWNLVQQSVSTLDLPYGEFAQYRLGRYETLMTDMDFDDALNSARHVVA
jgi:thiamine kinase-like enzyme